MLFNQWASLTGRCGDGANAKVTPGTCLLLLPERAHTVHTEPSSSHARYEKTNAANPGVGGESFWQVRHLLSDKVALEEPANRPSEFGAFSPNPWRL